MAPERVKPNPENCSLTELETAMRAARTQRSANRFRAIRALILGQREEDVALIFEIGERTLERWVARFNRWGLDGLLDRPRPGAPRKIAPQDDAAYRELLHNPQAAGQAHWTAVKFHGWLRREVRLEVGYSTVVRWMHEQGFRLKVPQPWPDRQDEALRTAFIEQLRAWLSDEQIELWYLDETGIEGDPRPRRRWALKGDKPRVTKNGDHLRINVTGMICPRTGQFYGLEFSHTDSVVFQTFLDHAGQDLELERPRNLLICDNASWHKNKQVAWGRFEPVFLPPYSPDLNPIERLWLLLKAEWFSDFVAKDRQALMERLDRALCWLIQRADDNRKTARITT